MICSKCNVDMILIDVDVKVDALLFVTVVKTIKTFKCLSCGNVVKE